MSNRAWEPRTEYWREHLPKPSRALPLSTFSGVDPFVVQTAIDALEREFS